MEEKTFLLRVPESRWREWKDTLPRDGSLNDHLNQLMQDEIEEAAEA